MIFSLLDAHRSGHNKIQDQEIECLNFASWGDDFRMNARALYRFENTLFFAIQEDIESYECSLSTPFWNYNNGLNTLEVEIFRHLLSADLFFPIMKGSMPPPPFMHCLDEEDQQQALKYQSEMQTEVKIIKDRLECRNLKGRKRRWLTIVHNWFPALLPFRQSSRPLGAHVVVVMRSCCCGTSLFRLFYYFMAFRFIVSQHTNAPPYLPLFSVVAMSFIGVFCHS